MTRFKLGPQPVWVVMGNDFPEAVFDKAELAHSLVAIEKAKNELAIQRGDTQHRIYWRAVEFTLNKGPEV